MKRKIISKEEMEQAYKKYHVPNERKIIVVMKDISVMAESSIPKIPRDENDPKYIEAERQFLLFYAGVLKFINTIPEITIFDKGSSDSRGSITQYLRFTIDDPVTGSPVHYMFELRTSDHLLPEDWAVFSLLKLKEIIDRYEKETGDELVPIPLDFIVNDETHNSYDEALQEVKNLITDIVKENTNGH